MKVWRLPEGGPTAKGRPMVNLLPLAEGETISTVLPLPEDEAEWGGLHIMFATAHGTVRRNSMDAFTNIRTAGKIAMRFGETESEDGDDENDQRPADRGRAADRGRRRPARHPRTARRSASSRPTCANSSRAIRLGVRGVRLLGDDEVISMSILRRVGTTQEEREAYLNCPPWRESEDVECTLPAERYAELAEKRAVPPDRHRERLRQALARPMNIAAPTAAARASPTSTRRSATAASSPASRSSRASN